MASQSSPSTDVHVVDTGFRRSRFDAAQLLFDAGRAACVDTGTCRGGARLLAVLSAAGLAPEASMRVIVTHVRLDHAGGAAALMQALADRRDA